MIGTSLSTIHAVRDFALPVATGICLSILLLACQRPETKVENAKAKVADASQDLKEARREVRVEWQENERRIIALRKEVNEVHRSYRDKYTSQIDGLEQRNNELRDRVNNCRDEGADRWQEFKNNVKHDMSELKSSLSGMTVKNS